jgi:spore maturation protein CgeB
MSRRSVVLVAAFDDALHAHNAQRSRALERLDCDVTAVNTAERRGPLGLFRRRDLPTRLEEALRSSTPDLVLAIGAPELDAEVVLALRAGAPGVRWVNWFPDDLRTVDRAVAVAPAWDTVYAVGSDVAARLGAALGRDVAVLPFACDPSVYRPGRERDHDQHYRANVVFAGTATSRREVMLTQLVEFGLAIWGPGWRSTSLRDYCRGETLRTDEFARAYAGASVALNIHHTAGRSGGREAAVNQRTFEIAAIGALQVVDQREDIPRWFEPFDELFMVADADDLRRTVKDLLQDAVAAQRVAEAGRLRVLAEHTYMHRMLRILGDG